MIDILAIGAHPDDIEFGCGGILARAAQEGKKIAMVDLTLGERGSHGSPEIRSQESQEAAKLIGATRESLGFIDCEVFDTYHARLKLVEVIRKYRPHLVLAPPWEGVKTHPDHLACGLMARHACRYARFGKILPEIPAHQPAGILHYPHWGNAEKSDFLIDISDQVELWQQMILCHRSQLQTRPYDEWCLRIASRLGVAIGCAYAQGLIKGNPIKIDDLMDVAQGSVEI